MNGLCKLVKQCLTVLCLWMCVGPGFPCSSSGGSPSSAGRRTGSEGEQSRTTMHEAAK